MDNIAIATVFANALNRERALTLDESELLGILLSRAASAPVLRRWSPADDRQLAALRDTFTAPQIAAHLGRTPWSVRSRIRSLKRKTTGTPMPTNMQDRHDPAA